VSKLLDGLNRDQQQAVLHSGSPLLILAGAGSGKTRVLTHRAAHLVESHKALPENLLLLTFTNKAAGEMKNRMAQLLSQNSKVASENCFAGTFHSFSCRLLRKYGPKIGIDSNFTIYDSDDSENLIRTILSDTHYTPQEFKISSLMYYIENCKNNFIMPDVAADTASGFWESVAAKIYVKYQASLRKNQALDFSDLIFQATQLLTNDKKLTKEINNLYQYILVDEYQDTNQTQYLLTKLLAGPNRQITAVGDASQSIYGWRGADYKNLTALTRDFPETTIINLEQNYRSTQTILDAANNVISQNKNHPVLKLFTNRNSLEPIHLYSANDEIDEANYVSQKIKELETKGLPYKEIAVLYRMNSQSRVVEEAFLKNKIPYVLVGGLRFYDRAEVRDILAMLRYIQNSKDDLSLGRLYKSLGKRRTESFIGGIDTINKKSDSIDILNSAVNNSNYMSKFDSNNEEDIRHLDNIEELKSVASTFPKLSDFLENVALVQNEYSLQEKNKDKTKQTGVRLMTLHASKGLEFEAVFLLGFEEGLLPHSRSAIDPTQVEEERRLCYVGITRAKDFLYITYTTRRQTYGKSSYSQVSRFLQDIPEDLIQNDFISQNIIASDELIYDVTDY
jgi:DNA helicase-2/ATP-dependent DNA helicase PcrA